MCVHLAALTLVAGRVLVRALLVAPERALHEIFVAYKHVWSSLRKIQG